MHPLEKSIGYTSIASVSRGHVLGVENSMLLFAATLLECGGTAIHFIRQIGSVWQDCLICMNEALFVFFLLNAL